MNAIDNRDDEETGPRCLGCFSIKCALMSYGVLDILTLAALITVVALEYFTKKWIVTMFFIFLSPCVLTFIIMMIEDN